MSFLCKCAAQTFSCNYSLKPREDPRQGIVGICTVQGPWEENITAGSSVIGAYICTLRCMTVCATPAGFLILYWSICAYIINLQFFNVQVSGSQSGCCGTLGCCGAVMVVAIHRLGVPFSTQLRRVEGQWDSRGCRHVTVFCSNFVQIVAKLQVNPIPFPLQLGLTGHLSCDYDVIKGPAGLNTQHSTICRSSRACGNMGQTKYSTKQHRYWTFLFFSPFFISVTVFAQFSGCVVFFIFVIKRCTLHIKA